MGNNKTKSNNKENDMEFIGKFATAAMVALAAWATIILLSLSASLAVMGERYRSSGRTEGEIFKAKFWRLVGLLPFVLVLAYFTAQYFPKNISIKNVFSRDLYNDTPKTENDFRIRVEDAKAKIESTQSEIQMLGYSIQSNVEDAQRIDRDLRCTCNRNSIRQKIVQKIGRYCMRLNQIDDGHRPFAILSSIITSLAVFPTLPYY